MNGQEQQRVLKMKVDMNIIQHLGIAMYSTLPPVIAELVANSWDADARHVWIELYDEKPDKKKIIVKDDGTGMSLHDIQNSFLVIGRNRRKERDTTPGGRKVIGRKGIGKLSVFGIADEIIVTTVKQMNDGRRKKSRFRLILEDIKTAGETYYPECEMLDVDTDEEPGTTIEITRIRRKSPFNARKIAVDLARRFLIFDEDFTVWIKHNDNEPFKVSQEMRFEGIEIEFEWSFPESAPQSGYEYRDKVKGKIYSAKKPVPEDMKGIYLVARGKLVHRNDFYGIRSSDYAHAYLTGWLEVDFIDDDPEEDNISTNRQELTWEKEELQELREYLQRIISSVTQDWRKRRRDKKREKVRERTGINIPEWIDSLDPVNREIARRIVNSILDSDTIEEEKSADLIMYVHDMFEFDTFKNIAAELLAEETLQENKIFELMKKWELVEAQEMYKLSRVRVDTIKNFERLIKENAKEVPTMHEFFKKFPWLLDPRIIEFKHEASYSEILKENYPEEELEEKDRRIDFLCTRLVNTLFVIELKRPKHTLTIKDLDQVEDYVSFLKERCTGTSPESPSRIEAYVIVGEISNDRKVKLRLDALKFQGIYVKLYHELLQEARQYHNEFIERYEKLRKRSG